jgi:hypothetical protein
MTVNTRIIKLFLKNNNLSYVPLKSGLRLQVLPDISHLPHCQKHHFAAFIQDSATLIVWDDDPNHILQRVQNIEDQLIQMIWKEDPDGDESSIPASAIPSQSNVNLSDGVHVENENAGRPPRRVVLIQPILAAITLILLMSAIGSGWREIAVEIKVDKSWLRLAFLAVVPLQCWLALFFMQSIAGCIAQVIGPISQMNANTRFYSGQPPPRLPTTGILPHVTIQCPVYKEGLWAVIDPTIKSIKDAISTYEMQGGSTNIFVNDDGMRLISDDEALERRQYYDEHNIGWVARPGHRDPWPADASKQYIRAGKFKKASNMNYALSVSNRIEDIMATTDRSDDWDREKEQYIYWRAQGNILDVDKGLTWAGGNVRVGDYILLIDSDTRVPVDCLLDAVSEMEASPQVAVVQFSSGVMNVTDSWFEKGITFFTNLVYTAIQYAVSNGDVAPFVGHNAFLRWSAVQDVAYLEVDVNDGIVKEKYWSESTVSEDFDMALRLQTSGYTLRLAAYAGQGFKEGVSLTVYDELARWEKYAYGCSELIFHPFVEWPAKGPFTPLFRKFMMSGMPLPSKLTIMAYIGTYYAIGSAWILTLLNYCIIGWYNGFLDHYYIDSFKVYFSIILVFTALGNFALAVLRYRIEESNLLSALWENFRWIPLLTIFLGGISLHVSQAILSHLFSVDMTWGATSKEATDTSFFKEVPFIMRKFRVTFIFCTVMSLGMTVLAGVGPLGALVPYDWQINFFTAIWPLATVIGKSPDYLCFNVVTNFIGG